MESKYKVQSTKINDGVAGTARAFATYSLVPYLGIVFCPGAVVVGTVGLVRSYRSPQAGDSTRGVCYASTIVGLVVLAVQLALWWVLYQAPMWANQI
ncbi:MAG TPA: hypothetical protein VGQ41_03315 [Pyrinomonadaceae bacterium]|nr:hypothetical protein [Pyrinomonadaceae bacterium]